MALVITIIVLIILAGVSINAVMNQGLITNAKDASGNYEKEAELERVKLAVVSALADGEGTINIADITGTAKGSLKKALTEEFGTNSPVVKEYTAGTITLNGKQYSVTSSGAVTQIDVPSSSGAQWSLPEGDTVVNVGDLLTPTVDGLENEKFYVIAADETTLTLLTERCINTSTNVQVDSGYSKAVFDYDSNVYNGSDIQNLVNAYVGNLTGLDLENVEVAYNEEPVANVKGRLMWYEEADNTTFKEAENYTDILCGPSNAKISFWLGSPHQYGVYSVFEARGVVDFDSIDASYYGVRPVIKISKSSVE